ncbi:MAG: efflux RND transporter periplasmic adaptor subunit [Planctomycetia bacterium]
MLRIRLFALALQLPLWTALPSCTPHSPATPASEEHDHEHDPASMTVFGERILAYIEHPHLARGVSAKFLVHITVLATGEPVRDGSVVLEIGSTRLEAAVKARDGLFTPEGAPPEDGYFKARLVVKGEQVDETLELGEVEVHRDAHEAAHSADDGAEEEPANAVPFLLETQWKLKLLVAQAGPRVLARRHAVLARAVVPEGRTALVSSPVAGRLVAPTGSAWKRSGERVEAGQLLAQVEPPLLAADLVQARALELEFGMQALQILRAKSEAETRLRYAEREVERIVRLRGEGLGTQQQLEQAERDAALARAELAASARMQAELEATRSKASAPDAKSDGAPLRLPIAAPLSGILVEAPWMPGAQVQPGECLARIVDASVLWVEGRVLEHDLPSIAAGTEAVAEFPAMPGRTYRLRGPDDGRPRIGAVVDDATRTIGVRYELDNSDGGIRAGMQAELSIATSTAEAPIVVPREAIVMDQGLPTAYAMLAGELFQRRELELGVEDGAWVEVKSGLRAGERVATRGAHLVKLAGLAPASIGHGHSH